MDIKVNNIAQVTQVPDTVTTETGDGTFKFTLASAITDADLQAKVDLLMNGYPRYEKIPWTDQRLFK
mgnify:CR=1 FL=1